MSTTIEPAQPVPVVVVGVCREHGVAKGAAFGEIQMSLAHVVIVYRPVAVPYADKVSTKPRPKTKTRREQR